MTLLIAVAAQATATPKVFRSRLPGDDVRTPPSLSHLPLSSQRLSVGRQQGTARDSRPGAVPAGHHGLRQSTGTIAGGGGAGGMTSGLRVGTAHRETNAINYASLARPQSYPARSGAGFGPAGQAYMSGGVGAEAQQQQLFSARHDGRYFQ